MNWISKWLITCLCFQCDYCHKQRLCICSAVTCLFTECSQWWHGEPSQSQYCRKSVQRNIITDLIYIYSQTSAQSSVIELHKNGCINMERMALKWEGLCHALLSVSTVSGFEFLTYGIGICRVDWNVHEWNIAPRLPPPTPPTSLAACLDFSCWHTQLWTEMCCVLETWSTSHVGQV